MGLCWRYGDIRVFRAEAKSNKGFGKGWEAEYLGKNKGF